MAYWLIFFDSKALSSIVIDILDNPKNYKSIRSEARKTIVENYDLHNKCLPEQLKIIKGLLDER